MRLRELVLRRALERERERELLRELRPRLERRVRERLRVLPRLRLRLRLLLRLLVLLERVFLLERSVERLLLPRDLRVRRTLRLRPARLDRRETERRARDFRAIPAPFKLPLRAIRLARRLVGPRPSISGGKLDSIPRVRAASYRTLPSFPTRKAAPLRRCDLRPRLRFEGRSPAIFAEARA